MRTKFRLFTAVLAIVALGVLVSGTAVASAHGKGKEKTLRLVADQTQVEFVDVGAAGPSLGDELVFSDTLSRRGREVGTSGVVCTITHVTPPYDVLMLQCVATLSLRSGQITIQGLIEVQGEDDLGPFTLAITGGTGAYRGAGGDLVVRGVTDTRSIYKLHVDSSKKKQHHQHK